jgi:hypothetical protein
LILAGAALLLGSALLFPLRLYFAGSAVRCLLQSAALQNLCFGSI